MKRSCGLCGGAVVSSYTTFRTNRDKYTVGRGLGHWRCVRGCNKRAVTVERVVNPKGDKMAFRVERDIPVVTE